MSLHSLCAEAEYKSDISQEEKDAILSSIYAEFSKVESYLNGLN
jgi:hypothetical protein